MVTNSLLWIVAISSGLMAGIYLAFSAGQVYSWRVLNSFKTR